MKTSIKDLKLGKCQIEAWIERVRDQKSMQFIIVKDRSGKLQITVEKEKFPVKNGASIELPTTVLCAI